LVNEESKHAKTLGEGIEFLEPELAVRETSKPKAVEAHPNQLKQMIPYNQSFWYNIFDRPAGI